MSAAIMGSRQQRRPTRTRLGLAATGLVVAVVAVLIPAVARGFLPAWILLVSTGVGAAVLRHIHALTGGRWGEATAPTLRALAATVPLAALGGAVLLLTLPALYPWARNGATVPSDVAALYLAPLGFGIRAVLVLLLWSGVALVAARGARPNRAVAAGSLVIHALCVNVAAVDWIMSIEPHWNSSALGALLAITQIALALAILAAVDAACDVGGGRRGDVAKLLLAAVLGVAYLLFMQFLVQWSGNLPEKVAHYLTRRAPMWTGCLMAATTFGFVLPVAILSRTALRAERGPVRLAGFSALAGLALLVLWQVLPPFRDAVANGIGIGLAVAAAGAASFVGAGAQARLRAEDAPPGDASRRTHGEATLG
ncbi:hypothetical protein [Mangrovicella endophytica]|uniref:hypothetical protein n=1 Tax=Mangrovicella endophytica TaxID=2066697 RepID=UPI0012FFD4A5|nr:hypothetical protein [Mangrovicella endophytica]